MGESPPARADITYILSSSSSTAARMVRIK